MSSARIASMIAGSLGRRRTRSATVNPSTRPSFAPSSAYGAGPLMNEGRAGMNAMGASRGYARRLGFGSPGGASVKRFLRKERS